MTFEIAQRNFPVGQVVAKRNVEGFGKVLAPGVYCTRLKRLYHVEVQWDNGKKSAEKVMDLSPQPNLSFLNK